MKGKLKFIGILCIAFGVFVIVRLIVDLNSKKEGQLRVFSNPTAAVFIDNTMKGNTPFDNSLKEGEYMLKIIPDNVATQAASWQRKITILTNTLTVVDAQLATTDVASSAEVYWLSPNKKFGSGQESNLSIETEPSGALVYLDNDEKGISPLVLSNLSSGNHELSLFMPGFARRTKKINLNPGYQLNGFIKLPVDPSQSPKYQQLENTQLATPSASPASQSSTVTILDTPTGWLRVREEPTLNASESGRVNPGQVFTLSGEQEGWYKIKVDATKEGWISSEYAKKK